MANTSILVAFKRFWQHTVAALNNKADMSHTHSVKDVKLQCGIDYGTLEEMNALENPTEGQVFFVEV